MDSLVLKDILSPARLKFTIGNLTVMSFYYIHISPTHFYNSNVSKYNKYFICCHAHIKAFEDEMQW